MPREKDNEKRTAILTESKRLFAAKGFHAASVADIAQAVDLPVGSIYTYFKNKDDVIDTIIEEGWDGFRVAMTEAVSREADPLRRVGLIVDRFLPELFKDVDFITLLLTEAGRIGKLEEKLAVLSGIVIGEIRGLSAASGKSVELNDKQAAAALLVFFLGSMDAVRAIKQCSLPVGKSDILSFIRTTLENAFGVKLPAAN